MFHRNEKTIAYAIVSGVIVLYFLNCPELGIALPVGYLFLKKTKESREKQLIFKQFPEFLLQLSSYMKYLPLEKALEKIEVEEPLKQKLNEFSTRLRSSRDISYATEVLRDSENTLIKLAARMIEIAYRTGKEMTYLIQSLGKEMIKDYLRNKDMEIGMLIERYTLLIGGGFLVPAILGIAFSFSSTLNIDFPEVSITQNDSIIHATLLANRIYLTTYSIIIGSFLGSGKNRLLYIALLIISTQGVFTISSSIEI
jgi:hypothetical protein